MLLLLNLLLGILVLIVVVFDMAHHSISFEYDVANEHILAKGRSALFTIPDGHPSASPFPILCLSSN